MKKFKFKLDSLLRVRSFQEDQQKLAVVAARQEVITCEERIDEIRLQARKAAETLETSLVEGIDAMRLKWSNDHLSGLSALRVLEEGRHRELMKILICKQQELTKKTIARKVVENLKSRKKEDYYQEAIKAEQKEMDDMVILRSARKAMG